MINKKAPYRSPKIEIPNGKFVIVDFINSKKHLIVFSYYNKTFDDKFRIKNIKAISI